MASKTTDYIIQKMNEAMQHFEPMPLPKHCTECDKPYTSTEPSDNLCDNCKEKEELETNKTK